MTFLEEKRIGVCLYLCWRGGDGQSRSDIDPGIRRRTATAYGELYLLSLTT